MSKSAIKKIVYCVSDIEKALAFEWIVENLDSEKTELVFILINSSRSSPLVEFLCQKKIRCYQLNFTTNISYLKLIWDIYFILKREHADGIHCHLLKANIAGLTAAYIAKLPIRIYTRHHSDFNYIYSRKGIWIDKYCNRIATKIIAISKVVEDILLNREKVPLQKVQIIHHGFDLDYFKSPSLSILDKLKAQYNPLHKSPVIGAISRFTEYKGLQYTIPAFHKLLETHPNALLLLFNAKGDYCHVIDSLLTQLPNNSYVKIGFENNLSEVYRLFDCFVHIPNSYYSEAFGQVYVEALICGIPSVFTISGIAPSLVRDEVNALVVDYNSVGDTYKSMFRILEQKGIREHLIDNCKNADYFEFSLERYIFNLEKLYH
jgi:glycosyltransferase involved in cell wall biosynthesis